MDGDILIQIYNYILYKCHNYAHIDNLDYNDALND